MPATVFFCFVVQFLCLKMCANGGSVDPGRGGLLGNRPPGVAGDRLPWVGLDKRGEWGIRLLGWCGQHRTCRIVDANGGALACRASFLTLAPPAAS